MALSKQPLRGCMHLPQMALPVRGGMPPICRPISTVNQKISGLRCTKITRSNRGTTANYRPCTEHSSRQTESASIYATFAPCIQQRTYELPNACQKGRTEYRGRVQHDPIFRFSTLSLNRESELFAIGLDQVFQPELPLGVIHLFEFSGNELVQFLDAVVRMIADRFRSVIVLNKASGFQFRQFGMMQIETKSSGVYHST